MPSNKNWLLVIVFVAALVANGGDSRLTESQRHQAMVEVGRLKTDQRVAFFEHTLKSHPEDREIQLELATAFIQKLRETGDSGYLNRASIIVNGVLQDQPRLPRALRVRNEIEMNLHHFAKVAGYAQAMLAANPSDAATVGLLGDAQMELGEYSQAGETYQRMVSLGANLFSYNRLAYYQFVTGNPVVALGWMTQAIAAGSPSPENVAWCYSELGDMLLKLARTRDAESAYQRSLDMFPGYHRAYAGLGRTSTERGDLKAAISYFFKAQSVVPLPEYAGALETLYTLNHDIAAANGQRAVLDAIEKLMVVNGEKANRALALVYADNNRNLPHALDLAKAEFDVRKDVYSWDALGWVLYKNKQFADALQASGKAVAPGTPEPNFYFHAGMIALTSGDNEKSRSLLQKALALNPNFDARNARVAKTTLDSMAPIN